MRRLDKVLLEIRADWSEEDEYTFPWQREELAKVTARYPEMLQVKENELCSLWATFSDREACAGFLYADGYWLDQFGEWFSAEVQE